MRDLIATLTATDDFPTAVDTIKEIALCGQDALPAIPAIIEKAASGGDFYLLLNSISIVDIAKGCGQPGITAATTALAASLLRFSDSLNRFYVTILIDSLLDSGADGSGAVPFLEEALQSMRKLRESDFVLNEGQLAAMGVKMSAKTRKESTESLLKLTRDTQKSIQGLISRIQKSAPVSPSAAPRNVPISPTDAPQPEEEEQPTASCPLCSKGILADTLTEGDNICPHCSGVVNVVFE